MTKRGKHGGKSGHGCHKVTSSSSKGKSHIMATYTGAYVKYLNQYLDHKEYLEECQSCRGKVLDHIIERYEKTSDFTSENEVYSTLPDEEIKKYSLGYQNLFIIDEFLDQTKRNAKLEKLPIQVAEVVMTFIELLDLCKLPSIVQIKYVTSLLHKLEIQLTAIDLEDNGIISEIRLWQKKIKPTFWDRFSPNTKTKLNIKECEDLETCVSGWLEHFKASLYTISAEI